LFADKKTLEIDKRLVNGDKRVLANRADFEAAQDLLARGHVLQFGCDQRNENFGLSRLKGNGNFLLLLRCNRTYKLG
jgi:hypothetical protein